MDRVSKRFRRQAAPAVAELSLTVDAGTILGIVGPNGAGKTTVLRLLAGVLAPDSGKITIGGHPLWETPRAGRAAVGYMPEEAAVYPPLSLQVFLDFFGRCYGVPAARRQQVIPELLALVGLTALADEPCGRLTRGQRQRLALARALVHDPLVLLLDDPARGLDPRGRLELDALLRELAAMGKTIVLAGQVPAELGPLCDRVGLLVAGRLVGCGPLAALQPVALKALWRLQILGERARAVAALSAYPGVEGVFSGKGTTPHWLDFLMEDEAEQTAGLLEHLAGAGVRVASLKRMSEPLEDIYLAYTEEAA
jgi:ABC-2 type transport system ATP-binding protein